MDGTVLLVSLSDHSLSAYKIRLISEYLLCILPLYGIRLSILVVFQGSPSYSTQLWRSRWQSSGEKTQKPRGREGGSETSLLQVTGRAHTEPKEHAARFFSLFFLLNSRKITENTYFKWHNVILFLSNIRICFACYIRLQKCPNSVSLI